MNTEQQQYIHSLENKILDLQADLEREQTANASLRELHREALEEIKQIKAMVECHQLKDFYTETMGDNARYWEGDGAGDGDVKY